MSGNSASESEPTLSFIRDEAAAEDSFKSHTRVAETLASVIRARSDLKVVGLLGPWGSGKSTVLRLAQSLLENDKNVDLCCFFYDAWLHQNDPPRRSFLETLVHFLNEKELATKQLGQQWQQKIDRLNRRVEEWETTSTPTLTVSGRLLVLSLLFVPVGMEFAKHEWFEKFLAARATRFESIAWLLGLFLTILPILLAVGIYLWWRPWGTSMLHTKFWVAHRGKHEDESILTLLTKKETQKSRHRITRDPEPTTIEFQDFFREIMEGVASGPDYRL
jgi:energy-coupling factor transporter ATP-binding protein EcfA2